MTIKILAPLNASLAKYCVHTLSLSLMLVISPVSAMVNVIYDTDMSIDADDAGALAVLHHFADQGRANILAIVVNGQNSTKKAARSIDAINTYYGRPNIPIGTQKSGHRSNSQYTNQVAGEFPNDVPLDDDAPNALRVYLNALNAANNNSVTIISAGFLGTLQKLHEEEPNLVRQKVKKLIVMGGRYPGPGGKPEFNFRFAPGATKYVLDNWPTEIIFTGAEIGVSIKAGRALQHTHNHPVARAYELHKTYQGDPAIDVGKASFDHTAVMLGVLGIQNNWNLVSGTNTFDTTTLKNTFMVGAGTHKYITPKRNTGLIGRDLDRWMVGWMNLENRKTGRCLSVANTNDGNGGNINQQSCAKVNRQRWSFKPRDNNNQFFSIISRVRYKCAEVKNNGANIQQGTCDNSYRQRWDFIPKGADFYQLKNRATNQCLQVQSGAGENKNGQNVVQQTCNNGRLQQWKLVRKN